MAPDALDPSMCAFLFILPPCHVFSGYCPSVYHPTHASPTCRTSFPRSVICSQGLLRRHTGCGATCKWDKFVGPLSYGYPCQHWITISSHAPVNRPLNISKSAHCTAQIRGRLWYVLSDITTLLKGQIHLSVFFIVLSRVLHKSEASPGQTSSVVGYTQCRKSRSPTSQAASPNSVKFTSSTD
jgi:hypothetical protein